MAEEISVHEKELYGCKVFSVELRSANAAEHLNKAVGTYITISFGAMLDGQAKIETAGECLASVLEQILRPYYDRKLCVCGLGNSNIPADALGPEVTRNLPLAFFTGNQISGNFRDVCAFAPGTSGLNNMDTGLVVSGVAKAAKADCVLLVDSIATSEVSRLFQTIQISTAGGTTPYSAGRKPDWSIVGLPVISLGVPTTIPLSALTTNATLKGTTLTSIHIGDVIAAASTIIIYAILRVCWPSLSKSDCFLLTKAHRDPLPYSPLLDEGDSTTAGCS